MRWLGAVFFVIGACSSGPTGSGSDTSTGGGAETTSPTNTGSPATTNAPTSIGSTGDPSSTTASSSTTSGAADTSGSSSSTTGSSTRCGGAFPRAWPDGTSCPDDGVFVHRYSENTFILRQSLCTGFEGPFLYLLFGDDRVLLEDTGYNGVQVAPVVYGVIEGWLAEQGRESIELVVASSHGHGDHVGGNGQFAGQPNTTVVGFDVPSVSAFFGIENWRQDVVQFDLGGRVLDVIPIPGHHSAHIAFFDRNEGLLLTGDTLYPGRLYIADFAQYVASITRMVDIVADEEVCSVLGTHIEMTDQAGVDFRFGADEHPGERELQLGLEHLLELRDAVTAMDSPTQEVHDDFIIFPI